MLKEKIKKTRGLQYLLGIGTIIIVVLVSSSVLDDTEYHVVALILLLVVSVLAMFLDILPIILVAILSALLWNFLFIPPKSTFNISTPQDALLFLMYFVIAIINGMFTSKIRKMEIAAHQRKEKERTLELYSTLFNSLSHELKTPIATIIGSVDILRDRSKTLSSKVKHELYEEIELAGKRLHRQVEHFLDMSRLDSNYIKIRKDWYDSNDIIRRVVQIGLTESKDHHIEFTPSEDMPLLKIDGPLIEQILHNIIQNALQYTPAGSTIKITTKTDEDHCHFIITDNGEGIPQDKIDLVFEKFYRLPDKGVGGTGLGLSIAQGFAKAHNGKITLENLEKGGAKFDVSIPCEMNYYKSLDHETR